MVEHIIKSLTSDDLGKAILIIGLVREARLWHKQILEFKSKKK